MDVCPPDFHGHNRAPVRVRIHIRSHLTTSSTASESAPGSRSPDKARSLKVTQTTLDVMAMRYFGTAGFVCGAAEMDHDNFALSVQEKMAWSRTALRSYNNEPPISALMSVRSNLTVINCACYGATVFTSRLSGTVTRLIQ
jgi:hypothetical protein